MEMRMEKVDLLLDQETGKTRKGELYVRVEQWKNLQNRVTIRK